MKKLFPIILGAALLFGGGAFYMSQTGSSMPGVSMAQAQEAPAGDMELAPDMSMGNEDAPITIIEYASYTCPHCARFHTDVFKQIKAEYIDTGKARFIHREVYFDRFGLWAGMVARCGGEMRYFGLNDLLYTGQAEWLGSREPQEILANLHTLGRTAGMNDEQLSACLEDQEMAQSMVAAYQTHATADEINSTPTFIINGEKYSNMSYADFAEVLDGILAE